MQGTGIRGRYDAFVSYSHGADWELARHLQRALERIGAPWYRARALRVFRDETDLTANPELWQQLTRELDAADFFVLLASPRAARSQWVNKEVEYWLAKRPADTLLIAVTAGELAWDAAAGDFDWRRTDCLPPALARRFKDVPTAADFRGIGNRKVGDPDFTQQAAKLVAAIRHLPVRELYDAEMTRYRRRLRVISGTAATLAALLVIVVWQLLRIQAQSRDALAQALASRARVEQTSAPARAALLAGTAVALRHDTRTRAQWIAAVHGLAEWSAELPGAELGGVADGGFTVTARGEVRPLPLPESKAAATTDGLRVIDGGRCIAEDYVTPAPQGGDVWVCNASELGFRVPGAASGNELWVTIAGHVKVAQDSRSCAVIPLLWHDPIRGDVSVGYADAAFLARHAHSRVLTVDDQLEPVEHTWVPLGRIDKPAVTAACALLFVDPTGQLRRVQRDGGQSLVSDSTYGPIRDYRVSLDGHSIVIQHRNERFVVRRADPLRAPAMQRARWAASLRTGSGAYRGVEVTAAAGSGSVCLRPSGSTGCEVPLRLAPGVLGGDGGVFLDVSRGDVQELIASNFPGFVVCRIAGETVKCGEAFGIQRAAASAVAISADAKRAAVAHGSEVKIFDLPVARSSSSVRHLAFATSRLAFDGARLWLGGPKGLGVFENGARVVDVASDRVAHMVVLSGGNAVVTEDGGGQLAIARAGGDGAVGLGTLPQPATVLAAAAGQPLVAAGQPDGTLILWDVERRSEAARIPGGAAIRSATFRSDDRELHIVTEDGVTVIATDPEVLLRRTCDAMRFTEDEWRRLIDQVPPVDPCVPRGWLARVLGRLGSR